MRLGYPKKISCVVFILHFKAIKLECNGLFVCLFLIFSLVSIEFLIRIVRRSTHSMMAANFQRFYHELLD